MFIMIFKLWFVNASINLEVFAYYLEKFYLEAIIM